MRPALRHIGQEIYRYCWNICLLSLLTFSRVAAGQPGTTLSIETKLDSLKQIPLATINADSAVEVLKQITQNYFTGIFQLDSAGKYATRLYELGQQKSNQRGIALGQYYLGRVADGKGDFSTATEYLTSFLQSDVVKTDTILLANGLYSMANVFIHQGNLEEALDYQLQVLRLDEISGDSTNIGLSLNNLGIIMKELNRNREAIQYLEKTQSIFENLGNEGNVAMALSNLGGLYAAEGDDGKALVTFRRTLDIYSRLKNQRGVALALEHIGTIQGNLSAFPQALQSQHEALAIKEKLGLKKEIAESYHQLALVHNKMDHTDSARIYFTRGLEMALQVGDRKSIRRAYRALSDLEARNNNFKKAYEYFVQFHSISDSILNESIANQISQQETRYGVEKKEAEISSLKKQQALNNRLSNTLRWALAATAIVALMIIGFLVYRARANRKMLQLEQKQHRALEEAYDRLKSTQAQLVQSEKMASLGELTAGIAHEIQNPLNFVNNFSEINRELVGELKREIARGNLAGIDSIAADIESNESKIAYHGKRADAIVKGMLQHSRASTGRKEPTDINAMCDEYLRLAFHGLRAKDKTFHATYETLFDANLEPVDVVPQDIGRVLLNVINNAFYAVREKAKEEIPGYEPQVTVRTAKADGKVKIEVEDNGGGIPESIRQKIFQPFFTTKPSGRGTGLGLSLSYDMVRAHGGDIRIESREGAGTKFLVYLPLA